MVESQQMIRTHEMKSARYGHHVAGTGTGGNGNGNGGVSTGDARGRGGRGGGNGARAEISLVDVPLDREVRVRRIDSSDLRSVHRLASLGILPGAHLRLIQNRAAFIAVVDRDQIAFDRQVASVVWVEDGE